MKRPSILSCLSGQCMLNGLDKGQESPDEEPVLPPPEEVLPPEPSSMKHIKFDHVNFHGGFTMLKGRVNAAEVLGIASSDLVPGRYEGGFKLWECAIDLVDALRREVQDGQLSFRGKRVLEIGCGHGLPGILACVKGASAVHFQDFNAEVLKSLTIPNVNANLDYARARLSQPNGALTPTRSTPLSADVHYFAGDWGNVSILLSTPESSVNKEKDTVEPLNSEPGGPPTEAASDGLQGDLSSQEDGTTGLARNRSRRRSGSRACESRREENFDEGGYDIILMSETVYSVSSFSKLYSLVKKCLRPYYGVVYVAGKKHYFGVGGGTRQFKHIVEEDGVLGAHLVAEFADGSSNVREIWKFFFKHG